MNQEIKSDEIYKIDRDILKGYINRLENQDNEIQKLQQQVKVLREACEIYATEEDWNFYCDCCADGSTKLEKDYGKRARLALEQLEKMG